MIKTGHCTDYNMTSINTQQQCNEAAFALNLRDQRSSTTSNTDRPEGCYFKRGYLWLATNKNNIGRGADAERWPLCKKCKAKHYKRNLYFLCPLICYFCYTISVFAGKNVLM